MPRQARQLDITTGECKPCPTSGDPSPPWLGYWVLGSRNRLSNNLMSIRRYDIGLHLCTRCPVDTVHIALYGSRNSLANQLQVHRLWDICMSLATGGIGFTLRGSRNHLSNP